MILLNQLVIDEAQVEGVIWCKWVSEQESLQVSVLGHGENRDSHKDQCPSWDMVRAGILTRILSEQAK